MKNKKTFYSIIIGLLIYMLLSWIIVAGNFSNTNYESVGFNQIGLFDLFLAPINLFNYYVISMTKNISGYVNQVGYGNIIIAFISIGIFYGVLNSTGAYSKMINDIKNKLENRKILFTLLVTVFYFIFSSLTGLNLLLFFLLPLVNAIMCKLNIDKKTVFSSTIGSMLVGSIVSLFNPTINGLNRILYYVPLDNNIIPRIILFVMFLIIYLTFILLTFKDGEEYDSILLYEEDTNTKIKGKKKVIEENKSYVPIIITMSLIFIILSICMYNWYYMFTSVKVTNSYSNLINTNIKDYTFMKNIIGMSESFGYWTGFTMSALLMVSSFVLAFLYRIKLDKTLLSMKKGFSDITPMVFYSILSLSLIVLSLYNSNSFIYSIINRILTLKNQTFSVLTCSFLHNIFINDYFALSSSLGSVFTKTYGSENLNMTLLLTQLGHGFASLITPFNVYLVAGLTYLNVSYTGWLKHIWKFLLIVIILVIIVLIILSSIK